MANRCPYCFTLLSDDKWQCDPLLSAEGAAVDYGLDGTLSGPIEEGNRKYKGFTPIFLSCIKEIQDLRKEQEETVGLPESERTVFSNISHTTYTFYKKYIRELRESTEKILDYTGQNLEKYLNYDENGIKRQELTYQEDWFDPNLTSSYIKVRHVEDLRKHLDLKVQSLNWLSLRGRSKVTNTNNQVVPACSFQTGVQQFTYHVAMGFFWSRAQQVKDADGDRIPIANVTKKSKDDIWYIFPYPWYFQMGYITNFRRTINTHTFNAIHQTYNFDNYEVELYARPRDENFSYSYVGMNEYNAPSIVVDETPRYPGERDRLNPTNTNPRPKFVSCGFLEDAVKTDFYTILLPYENTDKSFFDTVSPEKPYVIKPSLSGNEQMYILDTEADEKLSYTEGDRKLYITDVILTEKVVKVVVYTERDYVTKVSCHEEQYSNDGDTFEVRDIDTETLSKLVYVPDKIYNYSNFNSTSKHSGGSIGNHSIFVPSKWDTSQLHNYKESAVLDYGPLTYDDYNYGLSIRTMDVPDVPTLDYPLPAEDTSRPGSFNMKFQNDCLLTKNDGVDWVAKTKTEFSKKVSPSDNYIEVPDDTIEGTTAITITDNDGKELEVSVVEGKAYFIGERVKTTQFLNVTVYSNPVSVDKWYAGGIIILSSESLKMREIRQYKWIEPPSNYKVINSGINLYIRINYYNAPHNYNEIKSPIEYYTGHNYADYFYESNSVTTNYGWSNPGLLPDMGASMSIPEASNVPYNLKGVLYSQRTYHNHIYSASHPEPIGFY